MAANTAPSLTRVIHAVFLSPPSGLDSETMAGLAGKPYSTLMSELSGQVGHKLGADLVLPLCRITGSDEPLKFLARHLGGLYISLPEPAAGASELMTGLAESIKECSEFFSVVAQEAADGDLPRDQLDRIEKEGHEAIEAIMKMQKLARLTHQAQYGPGPAGKGREG